MNKSKRYINKKAKDISIDSSKKIAIPKELKLVATIINGFLH